MYLILIKMGFVEYLIDFFKRTGYFILGMILLPVGGYITNIGSTPGVGALPTSEPNTIYLIAGVIVIITGIAMMGYALKSKN